MSRFESNEKGLHKMTLPFDNMISLVVDFQEHSVKLYFGAVVKEEHMDMSLSEFSQYVHTLEALYGSQI